MPLPLTVSCLSKIQISFTFLVPAHPGSPGKRADDWVCVYVCVIDKLVRCGVLGVVCGPCSFPSAQFAVEQALPSSGLPAVPDQELQPDLCSVCTGASCRRLRFSLPPRSLPPWWHCFMPPAPLGQVRRWYGNGLGLLGCGAMA